MGEDKPKGDDKVVRILGEQRNDPHSPRPLNYQSSGGNYAKQKWVKAPFLISSSLSFILLPSILWASLFVMRGTPYRITTGVVTYFVSCFLVVERFHREKRKAAIAGVIAGGCFAVLVGVGVCFAAFSYAWR
jgi:hypothetical protein